MLKPTLALALALPLFTGCTDVSSLGADARAPLPTPDGTISFATGSDLPTDEKMEAAMEATMSALGIMSASETWQEADEALQLSIEQAPDAYKPYYREAGAVKILETHLHTGALGTEKKAALARYTEELVASGSPNSHTIFVSLKRLEGFWSEDKVRAAALASAEAGQAKALETCRDCDSDITRLIDGRDLDAQTAAKMTSVSALRDLAE